MNNYNSQPKNYSIFLSIIFAILILFSSPLNLFASLTPSRSQIENLAIEYLRLDVPIQYKDAWLRAEKASWEPWLLKQKGFIERKLFWEEKEQEAILLIFWSTRDQWKAIPQAEIEEIQKEFERIARSETSQKYGNPFPLKFEGELIEQ